MAKYLDQTGLQALWAKIKSKFISNVSEGTGITVTESTTNGFKTKTVTLKQATASTLGGVKLTDTINESDDVSDGIVPTPKAVLDAIDLAIIDAGAATNVYAKVAGDTGTTAQASTNSDTLTIAGGTGISTVSANNGADADTLTVNLDLATDSTIGGVMLTDDITGQEDATSGVAVTPYAISTIPLINEISTDDGHVELAGGSNTISFNGSNGITTSMNNKNVIISGVNSAAALNGTTVSMVTTGDKYNWNQAASRKGFKVISDGTNSATAETAEDTLTVSPAANTAITVLASDTNDTLTIGLGAATSSNVGGIKSQTANSSDNTYKVNVNSTSGLANVGIPNASGSTAGIMSSSHYQKLEGILNGAEVNQNAFGRINASGTILVADESEDTLNIASNSNSAITIDGTANTDTLTIGLGYATTQKVGGFTAASTPSYTGDDLNKYYSFIETGLATVNVPLAVAKGTTGARNGLMSSSMLLQLNTATSDIETLKTTVASAFTYQVESDASKLSTTPTADDMYIIYFIPIEYADDSDDSDESTDASHNGKHQLYAEYIVVDKGSGVYVWERLGTTDVNIDSITNAMIDLICV